MYVSFADLTIAQILGVRLILFVFFLDPKPDRASRRFRSFSSCNPHKPVSLFDVSPLLSMLLPRGVDDSKRMWWKILRQSIHSDVIEKDV